MLSQIFEGDKIVADFSLHFQDKLLLGQRRQIFRNLEFSEIKIFQKSKEWMKGQQGCPSGWRRECG